MYYDQYWLPLTIETRELTRLQLLVAKTNQLNLLNTKLSMYRE